MDTDENYIETHEGERFGVSPMPIDAMDTDEIYIETHQGECFGVSPMPIEKSDQLPECQPLLISLNHYSFCQWKSP